MGELKEKGALVASLYYHVSGKDSACVLTYMNQKDPSATDLQVISFSSREYPLHNLYELLSSFFGDPDKQEYGYKLIIKLGKESVTLSLTRINDARSLVITTGQGFFYLDEKQLQNLFYP